MKIYKYIVFLLLCCMAFVPAWADTEDPPEVTPEPYFQMPVRSTKGYEFYVAWLPNGDAKPRDKDIVLQLIVTSDSVPGHPEVKENQVVVEFYNGGIKEEAIPVGSTKVISIDAASVFWDSDKSEEEMPLSKGIRVFSRNNVLMSVVSTSQIGGTGKPYNFDGGHVLPKQALGNEYVVQTASVDKIASELVIMSTRPGDTQFLYITTNQYNSNKCNNIC